MRVRRSGLENPVHYGGRNAVDDSGDNTRMDSLRQTTVTAPDKISSVLDDPDGRSLMIRHTLLVVLCAPLFAQTVDTAFFESKIRPVLVAKCYGCHSSKLRAPMGALTLDTKAGVAKGGATGPAVVPGKPAESRLFKALTYTDAHLQMPPSGKLPDAVIADFEQWIAGGAPDPRADAPATNAALKGMSIDEGRKWWAFQPLPKPAATTKAATPSMPLFAQNSRRKV